MLMKRAVIFYLLFSLTLYAQAAVQYAFMPENPLPGEPVTIGVNVGSGVMSAALVVNGRRLARTVFFLVPAEGERQAFFAAVMAIPSTARPGSAVIVLESILQDDGSRETMAEISLNIGMREFASETIDLNPVLTGIRTDPSPQRTAEADHLWSILNRVGRQVYGLDTFIAPVTSTRRTSNFGSRRVFRYSDGSSDVSIHAGVDYGVPTGTVVRACAPGRVVLARNRIVTGNSVIIEHLPGIYSLYYHLDSIEVAENTVISAGTQLGLSGATGLATGPHLHWEIRVFGENTDPDAFIARPILDKDALFGKLFP